MDKDGYPKITDFGLAKENISIHDLTKTLCGTPEYIAPEIILRNGHGHTADWWALGCIIYEMLIGLPPFYVDDRREIYKRILQQKVKFPQNLNPVACDLIMKLLCKEPENRLGNDGGESIMAHPWFGEIDWELLGLKQIQPPFVPSFSSPTDSKYFSDDFTKCPLSESSQSSPSSCSQTFKGFSYNENTDSQLMELDL